MINSLEKEGIERSGVLDIAVRMSSNLTKLTLARMRGKTSEMKPLLGVILLDIARIGKEMKLSESFTQLAEEAFNREQTETKLDF